MAAIKLPFSKQIAYAFGMMGWSIMINLIGVMLVYFYLPPATSGLPKLISQVVIFGFFNIVALVTASSRLVDAFIDPVIAQFSDQSKNSKGRRIPFMTWAILPSLLFCCLVFYPLKNSESTTNIFWLIFTLVGFYVSSTTYIIPYNALLPELAPTSEDKVRLSTMQSIGYVFGIGIASNAFNLSEIFQSSFHVANRISALQLSVLSMSLLAAISMLIPVLAINEKKYCINYPSAIPIKRALLQTLGNKNFRLFLVADFSYFTAITIITSGLMYYVTVLLDLPESIGNKLMITMVIVSFVFYPLINFLAQKRGKKILVVFSFGLLSLVFLGIFFLGKIVLNAKVQIYSLIVFAAIPFASLNILPNAILAEIIEKDSIETKENKEAIYFAVRYFFVKIAQTMGIAIFATLLIYGKDAGNDFGIRLNGLVGFVLCLTAGLIFSKFKSTEKRIS
jgi:GPH family glycoside/pentoside/hexuronide:cation symporter